MMQHAAGDRSLGSIRVVSSFVYSPLGFGSWYECSFRSDATNNPFSHDQVCVFYHFLSDIKQHTTGAEFEELTARFFGGYINKDLNTQALAMDETSLW